MLLYSESKGQFCSDVRDNSIAAKILSEMERRLSRSVGENEIAAWRNSMGYMERAVKDVPDDASVSIEFMIPLTSKRVDFMLAGQGDDGSERVVIVELKQWSDAEVTTKDARHWRKSVLPDT